MKAMLKKIEKIISEEDQTRQRIKICYDKVPVDVDGYRIIL